MKPSENTPNNVVNFLQVIEDPFERELRELLNRHSKENGSNTADFQLARYLIACLEVFDETVRFREAWHGRNPDKPDTVERSASSRNAVRQLPATPGKCR